MIKEFRNSYRRGNATDLAIRSSSADFGTIVASLVQI